MRGVDTGERLGGPKKRQRNNFGSPWKYSCRKLRGGGDQEILSCSRIHMEVVLYNGN